MHCNAHSMTFNNTFWLILSRIKRRQSTAIGQSCKFSASRGYRFHWTTLFARRDCQGISRELAAGNDRSSFRPVANPRVPRSFSAQAASRNRLLFPDGWWALSFSIFPIVAENRFVLFRFVLSKTRVLSRTFRSRIGKSSREASGTRAESPSINFLGPRSLSAAAAAAAATFGYQTRVECIMNCLFN